MSSIADCDSDITNTLKDTKLHDTVKLVLERLQTVEREVGMTDGRRFLMRVLPYRTADDRIDGVVLTFMEIRERKRADKRSSIEP